MNPSPPRATPSTTIPVTTIGMVISVELPAFGAGPGLGMADGVSETAGSVAVLELGLDSGLGVALADGVAIAA